MVKWDEDMEAILRSVGVQDVHIQAAQDAVEELIGQEKRKAEVARELVDQLNREGEVDYAYVRTNHQVVVDGGSLTYLMEFAQEWRSEIEELQ